MESTASNEAGKSDALAVNFTFAKAPKPHSFIDNPSKTNKLKASIIHHPDVTPDFRRSSHTRRSLQSQGWIETQSDSGSFAVPMTPESLDKTSYILSSSSASSRYRPNFPMPKPEEVDDSFDIFDQGASQRAASLDARDDSEQLHANPLQERIARMKSKSKTPRGVPFASSSQSMLPHMTDSPVNLNSQLPRNSNFTNPKLKTIANIQSTSHRSSLTSFPRHAQLIDDAQRYSADRSASPAPRGQSVAAMRSASVESVVLPENRADPSSLDGMMATLQTWRAENKDLKLSLADIEAQLSSVKEERDTYLSEKTELEGRLAAAKAKGLEAVKTASERVEELKKELLGLKESADATVESSAGLTDVASELEALKDGSAKALALVESFFDAEQGYNFKLADSRALILELQEQLAQLDKDASNKQQVIDLLRERLETSTGEYLEQKDRMLTLEQEQGKNAIELRSAAASLSRTGEDLAKLKECQTQLVDALTAAVELEAKLNVANPRISELEEELRNVSETSQVKIASLEALVVEGQKQHAEFNGSLTRAEAQITELRSERDELLASNAVSLLKLETLSALEAEVGDLRIKAANSNVIPSLRDEIAALLTSNGTLRAQIEVLEAERTDISRLRGAEIQVLNLTETASDLQKKFDAATAQTMKERDAKLKAEAVREELQARLIQQEIEWKGEVKSLQDQLKQSEVDREVLSQRLDIEKAKFEEQHSQLNGNLLGSEMTCRIKDVEIRELQEILKERDAVLSSLPHLRERLQGAEEDRTELQAELTKATNELEISGKVVEIMRETQQNLHAEVASLRAINDETKSRSLDRANDAAELIKALESFRSDKSEFESSRDGHERELRGTITDLQVHLDNERAESKKASERIEELTSQLLEAEEQLKSFPERFEKGGALLSLL
ncbi:hypothetical protein DL93DRAFT_405073 [Clavulina sp. PMI_390]|nr:hypothetical protein DL93DRAFT_405073 [Clavulina sp. PMI_390]